MWWGARLGVGEESALLGDKDVGVARVFLYGLRVG